MKEKAAELAARTILVKKPAAGWQRSPSTMLDAANWGLIESLLGMKRTIGDDESCIEFVLAPENVKQLNDDHGFDIIAERKKANKGDLGLLPPLARLAGSVKASARTGART